MAVQAALGSVVTQPHVSFTCAGLVEKSDLGLVRARDLGWVRESLSKSSIPKQGRGRTGIFEV